MANRERGHDYNSDYEVTQDKFRRSERWDAATLCHDGFAQYRAYAALQPVNVEKAQSASEQKAQSHSPSRQKPPGDQRGADYKISIALKPPLDPTVVNLAHLRNTDFKLASLGLSRHTKLRTVMDRSFTDGFMM